MLGFNPLSSQPISSIPTVGSVAYTLTCNAGAYTYTGVAATLTYTPGVTTINYTLVCASGAYTYTGVATTSLKVVHSLVCASGAYTYTGIATTSLKVVHRLTCAVGTYAYTGVATTSLIHTHPMACASGAYTYTGVAATLTYVPGAGSIPYTLVCASGSYTYTGTVTTFKTVHSLVASSGAYTYTGNSATLTYHAGGSSPVNYALSCAVGAYLYTSDYSLAGYVDPEYWQDSATLVVVHNTSTGGDEAGGWVKEKPRKKKNLAEEAQVRKQAVLEAYQGLLEPITNTDIAIEVNNVIQSSSLEEITSDLNRVKALLALWKQELDSREQDDEEALLMLL